QQGPRVAVPIDTGSAALIIGRKFRPRSKLAHFQEMTIHIVEKENGRGGFEQVAITGPAGKTDRQAEGSGIFSTRLIEKSLAAQLSLRRVFSQIATRDRGRITETHRREMQILSIRSNHNGVSSHLFYAVGPMGKRELVIRTVAPADK